MTDASLAADFAAAMARTLAQGAPWPGAVAVSGGGDSLALMLLLADWATAASRPLPVVLTVDHGLTPNSARIAQAVMRDAKAARLEAHMLVWKGEKPAADIEAAAREARYRLMGDWCEAHRIKGLYVAHTLEDQAETFLLRLARGSGLDGLAAMRTRSPFPLPGFDRLCVVRPLLEIERTRLRTWLESRNEDWSEDPMNADPRFPACGSGRRGPRSPNSASRPSALPRPRSIWAAHAMRSRTPRRNFSRPHAASKPIAFWWTGRGLRRRRPKSGCARLPISCRAFRARHTGRASNGSSGSTAPSARARSNPREPCMAAGSAARPRLHRFSVHLR